MLLSLGACALFEPSGQRYVVFFRGSSAQMEDAAEAVLVGAANWAKKHPDMPVIVASYADPYGSEKANADFTRLRAQVVVDGLVANGVMASRIAAPGDRLSEVPERPSGKSPGGNYRRKPLTIGGRLSRIIVCRSPPWRWS